ncbi:hypothetical protein DMI62_20510 [Escherichia coli]|nr:hypothetical protein [Escherichia coli]
MGLYAISPLNGYRLAIREIGKCNALLDDAVALTPATAIRGVLHGINPERLTIELSDADGNIVLSYQEHQPQALLLPDVAKAPLAAQDITSTDEAGLSVNIWSNIITRAVHRSITTCAAWRWIRWIIAVIWRWQCWNITVPISRKRWYMPVRH